VGEIERQSIKSLLDMRISMGIACEKCAIVYLITSTGNKHIARLPRIVGPGMFVLKCAGGSRKSFHKSNLRPYVVSVQGYAKGYAKPGEYTTRQSRSGKPSHADC